jgi:hypothetical protein
LSTFNLQNPSIAPLHFNILAGDAKIFLSWDKREATGNASSLMGSKAFAANPSKDTHAAISM